MVYLLFLQGNIFFLTVVYTSTRKSQITVILGYVQSTCLNFEMNLSLENSNEL
jgi:hypothetical protein